LISLAVALLWAFMAISSDIVIAGSQPGAHFESLAVISVRFMGQCSRSMRGMRRC
jgi:hypothetical protein